MTTAPRPRYVDTRRSPKVGERVQVTGWKSGAWPLLCGGVAAS
jgi:hypothetical protein